MFDEFEKDIFSSFPSRITSTRNRKESAMKLIPRAVVDKFGRQILHVQKASPQIMFVAGVVGIVGAGVMACRSTLKVSEVLERAEKRAATVEIEKKSGEYAENEKQYARDLLKIRGELFLNFAKLYALPIGLGVVSIGLITGSHVVLNRRNASLTAAYAAVDQAFQQYRERVQADAGKDKDDEYRYGSVTVKEVVKGDDGKNKTVTTVRAAGEPSQYARLFSEGLENWEPNAEFNMIFLRSQQNFLNQMLVAKGHVFLNEVYDALGLDRSQAGQMVGWLYGNPNGDNFIDFGLFDEEGNERIRDFVNLKENSVLLDFNVDGVIYDLI